MGKDYIPRRDAACISWLRVYSARITADPESVGLSPTQASTLAGLVASFASLYQASTQATSRTPAVILQKSEARAAAVNNARLLARIIHSYPGTTDPLRQSLGLTLPAAKPSRVPKPASAPQIMIRTVRGRTVFARLRDSDHSFRRRRPPGVAAIIILAYVGPEFSESSADWRQIAATTRMKCRVTFPLTVPQGSKVWLCGYYVNAKMQPGPTGPPQSAHIQFGGDMAIAA